MKKLPPAHHPGSRIRASRRSADTGTRPSPLPEIVVRSRTPRTQFWDDFPGRGRASSTLGRSARCLSFRAESTRRAWRRLSTELEPAREYPDLSRSGSRIRSFDESDHATRRGPKHLGTDHHERIVLGAESVMELLPEVGGWLDEPFGDASILPTHLLSRFAREEVTVALGGDGADELMAGYPTFTAETVPRLCFAGLPRAARGRWPGAAVERMPVE